MDIDPTWEFVADTVMGGVSRGQVTQEEVAGRAATRLTGTVSLDNNGGFVQMAADLADRGAVFDASGWTGIALDTYGNGAEYEVRLRTDALTRPWQSFRATFTAPPVWTTHTLPFSAFTPHRTDAAFDPARLRRLGLLAIGAEMEADLAVAKLSLYR
jgi:adhesin HecA-like repeat protein